MKRIFSFLLLLALLLSIMPLSAYAAENEREVISFEDGSYVVVEIIEDAARVSGSKTGKKQHTYYDADDESQWKVVLTGSFTYTGSSSACTSSSVDVIIFDSAWYTYSKSASKSGNKATGSVTMKTSSSDAIGSVPVTLTLTCDANGNLS